MEWQEIVLQQPANNSTRSRPTTQDRMARFDPQTRKENLDLQPNLKYDSSDAIQADIQRYFEKCANSKGLAKHPTMAGLALHLGFRSTAHLSQYERDCEVLGPAIEMARTIMEDYKNNLLLQGGKATQGAMFDLKNQHKWADKIENTNSNTILNPLQELVQALQGQVLRPSILIDQEPEDAQYDTEEHPLI